MWLNVTKTYRQSYKSLYYSSKLPPMKKSILLLVFSTLSHFAFGFQITYCDTVGSGPTFCDPSAQFSVTSRSLDPDGSRGLSLNGPFVPGERINICIDYVYDSSMDGESWLQGIIPIVGNVIDINQFNPGNINLSPPGAEWFDEGRTRFTEGISVMNTYMDVNGRLSICDKTCMNCPGSDSIKAGDVVPGGWFWNTMPTGPDCATDGIPENSFGIGSATTNINFCLDISIKSNTELPDTLTEFFGFQSTSDEFTGCWESPIDECVLDGPQLFNFELTCVSFPELSVQVDTSICEGQMANLQFKVVNDTARQLLLTVINDSLVMGTMDSIVAVDSISIAQSLSLPDTLTEAQTITYWVQVYGEYDCLSDPSIFDVTILPNTTADEDFGSVEICQEDLSSYQGPAFNENGNPDPNGDGILGWMAATDFQEGLNCFSVMGASGCSYTQCVNIVLLSPDTPRVDAVFCGNEVVNFWGSELEPMNQNFNGVQPPSGSIDLDTCGELVDLYVWFMYVDGSIQVECLSGRTPNTEYLLSFEEDNTTLDAGVNTLYTYTWFNAANEEIEDGDPDQDPKTIIVDEAGIYTVQIEMQLDTVFEDLNAANCLYTIQEEVEESPAFAISCTSTDESSITFSWNEIPGAIDYEVYVDGILVGSVSDLSYIVDGLDAQQIVEIQVIPNSPSYCFGEGARLMCTSIISSTSSIEDSKDKIYPNPTKNWIHIRSDERINSIKLLDLQGRLMIETKEPIIDLESFDNGVYFISINNRLYKVLKI